MYSMIVIGKPRGKNVLKEVNRSESIAQILKYVFSGVYLQVGGDETIGKGFVKATVLGGINESENS